MTRLHDTRITSRSVREARATTIVTSLVLLFAFQPQRMSQVWTGLVFPGSDNDGTLWWLWARCKAPASQVLPSRVDLVAFPRGVSVEGIPFWNLYDQARIFIMKLFGCDVLRAVAVLNLLHVSIFLLTCGSIFGLIWRVSRSSIGSFGGVVVFVTSGFIDNSKMQISLSIVLFGVLGINKFLDSIDDQRTRCKAWCFLWFAVQALVNVYWAIFSLAALVILSVVFAISKTRRPKVSSYLSSFAGVVVGLLPLLPSQLRLATRRVDFELLRPLESSTRMIEPRNFFSKPATLWYSKYLDTTGIGPRLSWISAGLTSLLLIGILIFWSQTGERAQAWRRMCLSAILTSFLYVKYPYIGRLVAWSLDQLGFIRSVSMLEFFVFLFLSCAVAISLGEIASRWSSNRSAVARVLVLLPVLALTLHVTEMYDTQHRDFPVVNMRDVLRPWQVLGDLVGDGAVYHWPDIYDEWGEFEFGFPNRITLMAQIGMESPVANGRDVQEFTKGCGRVADLSNPTAVSSLATVGVSTIIVHRRFLSLLDLEKINQSLSSNRLLIHLGNVVELTRADFDDHSRVPQVQALDADVYSIQGPPTHAEPNDCRLTLGTVRRQETTVVSGPTYGQESSSIGDFFWHTGSRGVLNLTVKLSAPIESGRLVLRFSRTPCGQRVPVKLTTSDARVSSKSLGVTIDGEVKELRVDTTSDQWWKPFVFQVQVPEVECRIPTDPRTFGIGILSAVVE